MSGSVYEAGNHMACYNTLTSFLYYVFIQSIQTITFMFLVTYYFRLPATNTAPFAVLLILGIRVLHVVHFQDFKTLFYIYSIWLYWFWPLIFFWSKSCRFGLITYDHFLHEVNRRYSC